MDNINDIYDTGLVKISNISMLKISDYHLGCNLGALEGLACQMISNIMNKER